MATGLLLAVLALVAAWLPPETHPSTPFFLALGAAFLIPWAWKHAERRVLHRATVTAIPLGLFLILEIFRSPDRTRALDELFLLSALLIMLWLASLRVPGRTSLILFALGIAALSLWGIYQVAWGLEKLRPAAEQLPEGLRVAALARISQGRAFASLFLPSHLAVMLAMVLPLLLEKIRKDFLGICSAMGALLCIAGIGLTRSPAGVLLALGGASFLFIAHSGRKHFRVQAGSGTQILLAVLACGLIGILILSSLRPDVLRMEPLQLRMDNWRAALQIFSAAPFSGAGLGSFGTAVRFIPLELGNYPVHAHSLPLELMSNLGIAGFFFWCFAMVRIFGIQRRIFPEHPGLAIAIGIVPLHNFVDFSLFTAGVALPWVLLLGWAAAFSRWGENGEQRVETPSLIWRSMAFALVGIAILASTAHYFSSVLEEETVSKHESSIGLLSRAAILAPWRPGPVEKAAAIALETRKTPDLIRAEELLRTFSPQRPFSADRAQLMAHIKTSMGLPVEAAILLRSATESHFRDDRRIEEYKRFLELLKDERNDSR